MTKVMKQMLCLSVCLVSLNVYSQAPTPEESKNSVGSEKTVDSQIQIIPIEDALERALKHAPQIDIAEQELALRQAQLGRANAAAFLPKLEINALGGVVPDLSAGFGPANNFPDYDPGVKDLGPFIRSELTFVQPLFLFNKIKNLKKAAKRGVASSEFGLKAQKNEIIEQIQTVYWTHVYLLSVKDFIEELLDRAEQAKARVNERLDSGSDEVTDIDLMRVKVFINETQRRMADAQRGLDITSYSLKMLMGLPATQVIQLKDSKLKRLKIDLKPIAHYYERAKVARPEIEQIKQAVEAQSYLTKAKKADFFPNFFIAGQWNFAKAPGRVEIDNPYLSDGFNRNNGGASFGLRQNLSFFNLSAAYKEERAKLNLAESKKNLALKAIELDVRDKYLNLQAKKDSYKSSTLALKSARSWVLSSTLNFGAGLISARELLESFVGYASVKANFLEVSFEYNRALFRLRRAVGEDIVKAK